MSIDVGTPGALRPDADADSGSPDNGVESEPPVFDKDLVAHEVRTVLRERDPHGHRQIPGPTTETRLRERVIPSSTTALGRARSTPRHDIDTVEGVERTD